MRNFKEDIRKYLNDEISKNPSKWNYTSGANFGVDLQRLLGKYYLDHSNELNIKSVTINTNPNNTNPDIQIEYNDGLIKGIEVKSCKNNNLGGVTVCNSPQLINDRDTLLINYTFSNNTLVISAVIATQLYRLITINSNGKYKGCLTSTRDTGKKIKGRNYNDFINSSDEDDYTLAELTHPDLIRKTVLFYSASKLVDVQYNFTNQEIIDAVTSLRNR